MSNPETLNFGNSAIAFKHQSTRSLKKALLLFKSFDFPFLLKIGPFLARTAVALGMKSIIKNTIFAQFCGGETIEESATAISHLSESHIGTILDYSVEGEETETVFEHTCAEILKTIEVASKDIRVPFSVFKTTGIIRIALLEKVSANANLTDAENAEWQRSRQRFEQICKSAYDHQVKLFIDAEESWIQPAIDALTEEMMARFNGKSAIVYNTLQMYRHDRLAYLKKQVESGNYFHGFKLVRGAYMEKERERAMEMNYPSPIQPDKVSCDRDYDLALAFCVEHIEKVSICAGTHNEESSLYLTRLMAQKGIAPSDPRIYFSQLLGMSDHISFNLSDTGYNVAKYVPYGPVTAVIPYLTRRARENSSVAGQMGRERRLIETEIKRRKSGISVD
ncbi:MAG: proline dehydrogenase family protein [Bacteroidetes bacterium]|nr:proline dehydrogenase family protein [Bacteroidota bacterium]